MTFLLRRAIIGTAMYVCAFVILSGGWEQVVRNYQWRNAWVYEIAMVGCVFLAGLLNGGLKAPLRLWVLGMALYYFSGPVLGFLLFATPLGLLGPLLDVCYSGFTFVAPAIPTLTWWSIRGRARRIAEPSSAH